MDLLPLLGIAFGLAMDAFSVAVATGIALGKVSRRQAFRLSFHFGFFQFAMPILGWTAGSLVAEQIRGFDHWLAFGLLAYVGGKMLRDALGGDKDEQYARGDPTRGASLVMLSVATSIDAMAVGLSLVLIGMPILSPSVVIGAVAGNMTLLGLQLGRRVGPLFGRRMEVLGGLVLIGIGLKILFEHL